MLLRVCSVACLTSLALAQGGANWLDLDREIEQISQSSPAPAEKAGLKFNAYLKTHYNASSDVTVAPSGNDLGGFGVQAMRLNMAAEVGKYQFRASVEGTKSNLPDDVNVKDAFMRFPLNEKINMQMGNFKSPFLYTGLAADERLVFYERSMLGALTAGREPGLMIDGKFEQFGWYAAAQNGGDGVGDELLLVGRLQFAAVGEMLSKQEGGFGPDSPTRVTLAASYLDDGSADDATAVALEAQAAFERFWVQAELIDLDEGFAAVTAGNAGKFGPLADGTPFGVSAELMATPQWGFALRYDDADDANDTNTIGAGVNYYIDGHLTKWQFNYLTSDSDNAAAEIDRWLVGFTIFL